MTCKICCGSRRIRLPEMENVLATRYDKGPLTMAIREYPCPECTTNTVSLDHIKILQCEEMADSEYLRLDQDQYLDHVKHALSLKLGNGAYKNGLMKFNVLPEDIPTRTSMVRAELAIVSPQVVATLDQRIEERLQGAIQRVKEAAIYAIKTWGLRHERASLQDAVVLFDEALKR